MVLSIIVVSWNTKDLLRKCLSSVEKFAPEGCEVLVVDNGSGDGSSEMVKKNFPKVKLIENKENLGFARANNQAAREAKGEYLLILNSDTKVTRGAIGELLDCCKEVSACGPKLINPNGTTQHFGFYRRLPSLVQALLFYTDLYRVSIKSKFLTRRFYETDLDNKAKEVEQIPGAALMICTKVFKKLGGFDEGYPFWLEDVDLCFKLRQGGYKMSYCPEARVIHIGGASVELWKNKASREARFYQSLFIFFDKHKNFLERVLIRLIIHSNLWFKAISRSIMQIFSPNKGRGEFIKLVLEIDKRLLLHQISLPNNYD